ncbi:hypothetical protein FRB90_008777, partial [Tulasnella sp. 427]
PPTYVTTLDITTDYITSRGDPVAVETEYGTSCSTSPTSSIVRTTSTIAQQTSSTFSSSVIPTTQFISKPDECREGASQTSSSASPLPTHDDVVVGHKSHKTAAIAGGVVAAFLLLGIAAGAAFYFKFWKAGGGGKGGHHGHHGGEKEDIDWPAGGEGGGGGGGHTAALPNLGGTGIETSGAGGGGGSGVTGTAPGGGGGAGMDTSAVGGGFGGNAPPTTGFEGQFHTTLPYGASAPAHHAYPVIVPLGARRRESGQQGPQEMINTLPTPWVDPAHQQQQQQQYPGYYNQQQPWQNADPHAYPSSAPYSNSGPGWADPVYYSQSGYNNSASSYPQADPRMSQSGYQSPHDPRASGAYYPGSPSQSSHASPPLDNRASIISGPSSVGGGPGHARTSLLPYMNDYGAPQPGPSIAGTPAPMTSVTEASTDPFDKHAEAAAASSSAAAASSSAAAAGPSADHDDELPPPSYDEAGPSAQPFVLQDAKGRQ